MKPPFAIAGLDHLLVLVEGMPEALRFYEDALGCVIETRLPQYAMVELRAGASHIDLVDVAAAEGRWAKSGGRGRNVDHFALALLQSDEPALREHLAACGVAIVEERRERESLSLYVGDPSGNKIELICAKVPAL
jgi:catechol 2,3-dioxygenase-like lactoylglutathione lyase family enzyme